MNQWININWEGAVDMLTKVLAVCVVKGVEYSLLSSLIYVTWNYVFSSKIGAPQLSFIETAALFSTTDISLRYFLRVKS